MDATVEYSPELPDRIIHRIQSLLNPKESAKTTLLSKSWLRAWSTRPTIHLDENHFPRSHSWCSRPPKIDGLTLFAKNTFRMYKESNLRIDTFILSLQSDWYCLSGLATKWVSKALKMGATDFTFQSSLPQIALPVHAVFGSENVIRRLCLDKARIHRLKVIKCMGLRSLALSNMEISSDSSFFDIISCCPLIESLSLSNVWTKNQYNDDDEQRYIVRAGSMISFLNLTSLNMSRVAFQFQKLFLANVLSKFPNLNDLTLNLGLPGGPRFFRAADNDIRVISSGSLEILNLRGDKHLDAELEIDAPSIRKFTYEGSNMPKFSFRSKSIDQLESRISLVNYNGLSTTWFYKLSKFLTNMAGSKIRLCLHLHSKHSFDYLPGDIECLNVCEVENLTMDMRGLPSLSFYTFLDIFFRICHPKMITQYASSLEKEYFGYLHIFNDVGENRNNDPILCQVLEQGMKGKGLMVFPSQFMYGFRDLEELKAQQLFNKVWIAQPLDAIFDSTSEQRRFRFQLKWKHS